MSKLNRFFAKAKNAAKKVADKAECAVDSAAKSVKIKSLEVRVDEQYEKLGKLVYRDLHTDENLEDEKLEIIAAIDALFDQIALLKAEKEEADEAPVEDSTEEPAEACCETPVEEQVEKEAPQSEEAPAAE